jgi:hypothetical protein
MRLFGLFLLGTIGFVAISYFEQIPVLGWLGALVSVAGWVTLGRATAREGGPALVTSAVLGGWTGFVGAVTAWAFQTGNLFGLGTPPLDRVGASFGFVGATLGVFYWPLVGAGVCFVAAMAALGRRSVSAS